MSFPVAGKLLDTCVLGILSKEDSYGYDLTQKIGSSIDVSESALYPVLRRLLKEGLLKTYDKPFDGRNRKYYQITNTGRMQLEISQKHWESFKITIDCLVGGGDINEKE